MSAIKRAGARRFSAGTSCVARIPLFNSARCGAARREGGEFCLVFVGRRHNEPYDEPHDYLSGAREAAGTLRTSPRSFSCLCPGCRFRGPEIRLNYFGRKLPFPTRMTVVRLPKGEMWLHSPTEPQNTLLRKISDLGPVRFLIAPNTFHCWWIADWKARFPAAEVYAAPPCGGGRDATCRSITLSAINHPPHGRM
jgi:hypothetical protein